MRILFALAGLHRYHRGAETAFISLANELAASGDTVTLIGSGPARPNTAYGFVQSSSLRREHFESLPSIPVLRNPEAWEELSFVPGLFRRYRPAEFDVTLTCGYPFTNWLLRRPVLQGARPPHVFVTENGDWPAHSNRSEYHYFGCEGLVCTNPDYYERNKERWPSALIPNGIDCNRFRPGEAQREKFSLPSHRLIVLMVSALIPSKRVEAGLDAVSRIPDAHLVVAGDGPLRSDIEASAARLLPGRFTRVSVPAGDMPALYQSADVFLHLSKDESFGNVFLESMACGLPIVAHDTPRLRWIVGDDEFLLDTDDSVGLARHIELAHAAGSDRREERSKKAAEFSWEKIAERYRRFLQEVVRSSR